MMPGMLMITKIFEIPILRGMPARILPAIIPINAKSIVRVYGHHEAKDTTLCLYQYEQYRFDKTRGVNNTQVQGMDNHRDRGFGSVWIVHAQGCVTNPNFAATWTRVQLSYRLHLTSEFVSARSRRQYPEAMA